MKTYIVNISFSLDKQCEYFYVRTGYEANGCEGKTAFCDKNCEVIKGMAFDYLDVSEDKIELPNCIEEMIRYASILSKPFPYVSVDFYNINGKTIFGKLTFLTKWIYEIYSR